MKTAYMNKLMKIALLPAIALMVSSCAEDELLAPGENSVTASSGTPTSLNFSVATSDVEPNPFNQADGSFETKTANITARVGDRLNRILTSSHTVFFETDYGLIEPSCVTSDGFCTVEWTADKIPSATAGGANGIATVTAYTLGEEGFIDTNGNGQLDAGETFDDIGEPFVNYDASFNPTTFVRTFTTGDTTIDTVNAFDSTGNNGTYDGPDGLFNGAGCNDTPNCSTQTTIMVYAHVNMQVTVVAFPITVNVSGLNANDPVRLTLNTSSPLDVNNDGSFQFSTLIEENQTYAVAIDTQPATTTCTLTGATGTITTSGATVTVNCA